MKRLHLSYQATERSYPPYRIDLPPSKSIEARRLILEAISNNGIISSLNALGLPDDLHCLEQALQMIRLGKSHINVGESGTAMRLLLAYLCATCKQSTVLEGEGRQHKRPIAPLVEALRSLGAEIRYIEMEGYPPLSISPSQLRAQRVELDASQSSQYLSALLLIAPLIEGEGYQIDCHSSGIASEPYAEMTVRMMQEVGYHWQQKEKLFSYLGVSDEGLRTFPCSEADWSASSYAYLLACLDKRNNAIRGEYLLELPRLRYPSLQGDEAIARIMDEELGLATELYSEGVRLRATSDNKKGRTLLNCNKTPDLVPALVAALIASERSFKLEGVAHLRIKESDRLHALQLETSKLGIKLHVEMDSLSWDGQIATNSSEEPIVLNPHKDHRIAMALAPLMARLHPAGVIVEDANCVEKSFPRYWEQIEKLGYTTKQI